MVVSTNVNSKNVLFDELTKKTEFSQTMNVYTNNCDLIVKHNTEFQIEFLIDYAREVDYYSYKWKWTIKDIS